MEEEDNMPPPFWLQTTTNSRRRRRRNTQPSSIFLNTVSLLIILLVVAFIFVFVIVPSIISFTSNVFRPHLIKKGWDSVNLVLVLFAIVCGCLSKNNTNNDISNESSTSYYVDDQILSPNVQKSSYPSTPHGCYHPHDHRQYQGRTPSYNNRLTRLRSFSSHPDLREVASSPWMTHDERWRFYDDTYLHFSSSCNHHYQLDHHLDHGHEHHDRQQQEVDKKQEQEQEEDVGTKDIGVDTFVLREEEVLPTPPPPPPPPSPPPPSPPRKVVRRKVKRTYEGPEVHEKRKEERVVLETRNFYEPPPPPSVPPPPPPSPPPMFKKNDKKRGKDFLMSLRRKKKKQRQKSVENLDFLSNPEVSTTLPFISPPSPPPLPPPHFFQNLFASKKNKIKKIHSIPPPSAPPPPITRVSKIVSQNTSPQLHLAPVTTHKPPKPEKTSSFNSVDDNVESGNASPLIPIPPPPPPPPFKMPAWKFVFDGDYVRVVSFNSSRSGSPDLDSVEDSMLSDQESTSPKIAGNESPLPLFCPSPDVNTKADNFIARFRAGLKMEKMNSVKGKSNLGPETSTS